MFTLLKSYSCGIMSNSFIINKFLNLMRLARIMHKELCVGYEKKE
jgi:hypothetical protein